MALRLRPAHNEAFATEPAGRAAVKQRLGLDAAALLAPGASASAGDGGEKGGSTWTSITE